MRWCHISAVTCAQVAGQRVPGWVGIGRRGSCFGIGACVTCQLSAGPYFGFCVLRVSRRDRSGEMRREDDPPRCCWEGDRRGSFLRICPHPPLASAPLNVGSKITDGFRCIYLFLKHSTRKRQINKASCWCWRKRDRRPEWCHPRTHSALTPVKQSAQCTGVAPKRWRTSCSPPQIPSSLIVANVREAFFLGGGWFVVIFTLEGFMSTRALKRLQQPLTFWPSMPEITLPFFFFPLWFNKKCLFLASEESLLFPLRVHGSRERWKLLFSLNFGPITKGNWPKPSPL